MKFEKLSENKIRITLTINDLKDKDIDFHDFMSNPLETQDLFLDILKEANEQIGFNTSDYKVKIEALAMIDGDFVVNVTRVSDSDRNSIPTTTISTNSPKKRFTVRRKTVSPKSNQVVYKFDSFDDYCSFIQYLSQNNLCNAYVVAKKITLYTYENSYYLILINVNENYQNKLNFYSSIIEFGKYISNSTLFVSKLQECGKIVVKHNAIKTSLKHFESINK